MLKQFSFLKFLIPLSIILGFLQHLGSLKLYKDFTFFYETSSIYLFHTITTIIILSILIFINQKEPLKTGFVFMGLSLFKMMVIIIILIPLIKSDLADKTIDIFSFFIPYFLYLFFETFFAIRLINQK